MTNPGHELAALRPLVPHVCPVCGARFLALKTAKTCSGACRKRLHRGLVKEARKGTEPGADVQSGEDLRSTRRKSRKSLSR